MLKFLIKKTATVSAVFIFSLLLIPNIGWAEQVSQTTQISSISNSESILKQQEVINSLLAKITLLQAQLAALSGKSNITFSSDLRLGSKGGEVSNLQTFLISNGYLVIPSGISKGFFGELTKKALSKYQVDHKISPAIGFFGPITRAFILNNSGNSAQTNSTQPTTSSNPVTTPIVPIQTGMVRLSSPGFGGGGGAAASTVVADTSAPTISSVSVTALTVSSALVSWNTNESSNSYVEYGTTTSYGLSTTSASLTTSHSLTVTGLSTTTAYHFRVSSTDSSSNSSASTDQTLSAPAYYVDSVNGSDSNTGLSSSAPVKTIAYMESLDTANPLNTWNLAKDSHWRETLTVPRNSMTVQSYGSGTVRPLVDASDIISSSAWTLTVGTTNCYKAILPSDNANPNQIWVWENNTRLASTSSTSACDSTVGSYYIGNPNTTSPTIYVHSSSGIPSTNGMTYEYTARARAIDSSKDATTYTGLYGRRVQANDGSIRAFTNARISDSLSEESYSHQYYFAGGSLVTDSIAHNGGYGMYVLHPGSFNASGASGEVRNSRAYNDSTTYVTGASSFISHTGGVPDTFGTVTVDNLTSDNMRGPGANEVSNFIVKNTTITNSPADSSSTACFQAGVGTTTITNSSCQMTNGGRAIAGTNTAGEAISVNGLTLTGTGSTAYFSGATTSLTIATSTLIGGITMTGSSSSLNIRNNTWNAPSVTNGTETIFSISGVSSSNIVADYNSYLNSNFKYVIGATTYYSLPTVRSILGIEANSTPASTQVIPSLASTDLTQSGWAVQGVGSRTATSFLENTQTLVHRMQYSVSSIIPAQTALYTASAEVKPNGRNWAALSFSTSCGSWAYFDVLNGVVGSTSGTAPYAYGISALDNGYYKIWASYYANTNTNANIWCLSSATADNTNSFTGSASNGLFDRVSKLSEGGSPL